MGQLIINNHKRYYSFQSNINYTDLLAQFLTISYFWRKICKIPVKNRTKFVTASSKEGVTLRKTNYMSRILQQTWETILKIEAN